MYGFCSDGTSPAPSRGTCATVANGLATNVVAKAKNAQAPAEERHQVRHQLARAPAVLVGDERREAAEHEQPEQQRALLARPERRDQVRLRAPRARSARRRSRSGSRGARWPSRARPRRPRRTRSSRPARAGRSSPGAGRACARRRSPRSAHTPRRATRAAARRGRAAPSASAPAHCVGRDGCRRVLRRALRAQRVVAGVERRALAPCRRSGSRARRGRPTARSRGRRSRCVRAVAGFSE